MLCTWRKVSKLRSLKSHESMFKCSPVNHVGTLHAAVHFGCIGVTAINSYELPQGGTQGLSVKHKAARSCNMHIYLR